MNTHNGLHPDINADLGEGMGTDAAVMPFISSCNIACGGHAGDGESIRKTVHLALLHGVKIGAHPAYPDRENFGRTSVPISETDLRESLLLQIRQLVGCLMDIGEGRLNHVKLHGALYNDAAVDPRLANLVVGLLQNHFPTCILYAPFGSLLASVAAANGVPFKYEVFADRRYQGDYTLVPRSTANACIDDLNQIRQQVFDMVWHHRVKTIDGLYLTIQADTICVHGDHPKALSIATMLHGMFSGQNAEPL